MPSAFSFLVVINEWRMGVYLIGFEPDLMVENQRSFARKKEKNVFVEIEIIEKMKSQFPTFV